MSRKTHHIVRNYVRNSALPERIGFLDKASGTGTDATQRQIRPGDARIERLKTQPPGDGPENSVRRPKAGTR